MNSRNKGYRMGSDTGSTTIQDMNFAAETSVAISAVLSENKSHTEGISSQSFGYTLGGQTSPSLGKIDKFAFYTETIATISGTLSKVQMAVGTWNSQYKGYAVGGYDLTAGVTGTGLKDLNEVNFSTDAVALSSSSLVTGRYYACGLSFAYTGYIMGGTDSNAGGPGAGVRYSSVEKMAWSTLAVGAVAATLPIARSDACNLYTGGMP